MKRFIAFFLCVPMIFYFQCSDPKEKDYAEYRKMLNEMDKHQPSILKEEDSVNRNHLTSLFNYLRTEKKWKTICDSYGRPINKIQSPKLTFQELKRQVGFTDNDLSFLGHKKTDRAIINKPWTTLDVQFDKKIDSQNIPSEILCTGTITNHLLQKFVDKMKGRKYKYPSIMEEEDFTGDGVLFGGLRGQLIIDSEFQWDLLRGPRNQLWKIESPEMNYNQLKRQINFFDEDVVMNPSPVMGKPVAWIDRPKAILLIFRLDDGEGFFEADTKIKAILYDKAADLSVKSDHGKSPLDEIYQIIKGQAGD